MHRRTIVSPSTLLSVLTCLSVVVTGCSSSPLEIGGAGGARVLDEATGSAAAGTSGPNAAATGGSGGSMSSAVRASGSGGRAGAGGSAGSGGASEPSGAAAPGGRLGSGGNSAGGPMSHAGGRVHSSDGGPMGAGGATGAWTGGGAEAGGGGPAGGAGINPTACSRGTAQAGDVTIELSSLQQKISGFGVSSAWAGNFVDPAKDPDTLWSTTTGAGLTLHRIRIGGGTTSEMKIAQKAVTYGVKVWATPWEVNSADTDRANCPGNSSCDPPPKLKDPQDWARRLANFVTTMKDAGVELYAISAENEPDSGGMNGTTSFTADELATWIGSYLGPALANTGVKIMGPETMNWFGFPGYFSAIQKNTAAWNYVTILASHEYGRGPSKPEPAITDAGKEYWQTEVDTGSTSDDPTADNMPSALKLAETIHNDLTKANLNAWHYWWLYAGGSSGLFDTNTKVWTKRFWIMGNFSRFARPGYMRVSTSGTAPAGVLVSAYKNPADGTVVVVAINKNSSVTPLSLFVSGVVPCSMTPWVTTDTASLASQSAIAVSNARFTASLEAKSVTSFVGKP